MVWNIEVFLKNQFEMKFLLRYAFKNFHVCFNDKEMTLLIDVVLTHFRGLVSEFLLDLTVRLNKAFYAETVSDMKLITDR